MVKDSTARTFALAGGEYEFLGDVSDEGTRNSEGGEREAVGQDRSDDDASDSGPVDLASVAAAGKKRRGRSGVKWSDEERARRKAARETKKDGVSVPVEPPEISATVVGQLMAILYAVHIGLAGVSHTPEVALSEQEAEAMAKAIAAVGKYYWQPVISNKLAAWTALAMTAWAIYFPRVMAIREKTTPRPVVSPVPGSSPGTTATN